MDRFIRRQNIEHFRSLLAKTTDEPERKRILQLLKEEQEKQKAARDRNNEDPQQH